MRDVGRVALLATGVIVCRIVQRPEPVFVAAVSLFDGVEGAAIAAMAWRAAKLFLRVKLHQIGIGMAGERRVGALGQAEINPFGEIHYDWNDQRVRCNVTRLAAIYQANAANIVQLRAWRINVNLVNFRIELANALSQTSEVCGVESGQLGLEIFVERGLRVFSWLINVAALGDEVSLWWTSAW